MISPYIWVLLSNSLYVLNQTIYVRNESILFKGSLISVLYSAKFSPVVLKIKPRCSWCAPVSSDSTYGTYPHLSPLLLLCHGEVVFRFCKCTHKAALWFLAGLPNTLRGSGVYCAVLCLLAISRADTAHIWHSLNSCDFIPILFL